MYATDLFGNDYSLSNSWNTSQRNSHNSNSNENSMSNQSQSFVAILPYENDNDVSMESVNSKTSSCTNGSGEFKFNTELLRADSGDLHLYEDKSRTISSIVHGASST